MTNQAPTLPSEPKHFRIPERIRALCIAVIQTAENPQDRQKFSALLDLVTPIPGDWRTLPQGRADGRADHPSRRAVVYAKLLQAVTLIWKEALPKDIDPLITFAEKVSVLSDLGYRLVGDPGQGWALEFS